MQSAQGVLKECFLRPFWPPTTSLLVYWAPEALERGRTSGTSAPAQENALAREASSQNEH